MKLCHPKSSILLTQWDWKYTHPPWKLCLSKGRHYKPSHKVYRSNNYLLTWSTSHNYCAQNEGGGESCMFPFSSLERQDINVTNKYSTRIGWNCIVLISWTSLLHSLLIFETRFKQISSLRDFILTLDLVIKTFNPVWLWEACMA